MKILIYGDAFWPTYTTGDNTGLIATDSMKNFIQRETMNFTGYDLEVLLPVPGGEVPRHSIRRRKARRSPRRRSRMQRWASSVGVCARRPGPRSARVELVRDGAISATAEARSGINGFRLLRLSGSAFHGFVRDEYTTLPDITNRPLHMWLDLDWTYTTRRGAFSGGAVTKQVRQMVHEVFRGLRDPAASSRSSIRSERRCWQEIPAIAEIHLEAQ